MKGFQSLLVAATFVSLMGCDSSSETILNEKTPYMWILPGIGTTYIFSVNETIDTTEPGSMPDRVDTITVLSTTEEKNGKSKIIRVRNSLKGKYDLLYIIEPNGDFSFCDSSTNFRWSTFPVDTGRTISDPLVDTSYAEGSHYTRSIDRTCIGYENLFLARQSFTTIHVKESYRSLRTDSIHNIADTSISSTELWLAPAIGFLVKTRDKEVFPSPHDGGLELLTYVRH